MTKFFSPGNAAVSDEVCAAIGALGGCCLDENGSVGFGKHTIVVAVPTNHPDAALLRKAASKCFLTFENTSSLFVFLSKASISQSELQRLVSNALARNRIDIDFSCDDSAATYCGEFTCPEDECDLKTGVFDFLKVLETGKGNIVADLFGHDTLGEFQYTFEKIVTHRKDELVAIAPPIWVDRVLCDPDTNIIFLNFNVLVCGGGEYKLISMVVSNEQAQDSREIAKQLRSRSSSWIDLKGLHELLKAILEKAFRELKEQTWIRREGWVKSKAGVIEGFAGGQQLMLAKNVDRNQYFLDVQNPSFTGRGTLAEWREKVLAPASNSYLLLGALQLGLAGLMVDHVPSISSCIFNLYGLAGNGKTLTLAMTASLFGNTAAPGQSLAGRHGRTVIETFGSTSLALQAQAQRASCGLLLVDEVGSNSFKEVEKFIYTTANGSSRTRANPKGGLEESQSKTLFMITTGEVPLLSLISRNAKEGILDRAVDIDVGQVPFLDEPEDEFKLFSSLEHRDELIDGVTTQFGTAAPAFAQALLDEYESNEWREELEAFKLRLLENLPAYVASGGASRVLSRFALAGVAGMIALRSGVFDASLVSEENLFDGLLVCVRSWAKKRWGHLTVLADAIGCAGIIPLSSPKHQRHLYRHEDIDGFPTLMISKTWLQELLSEEGDIERISKRFREDSQLVRCDAGRHTVGKFPYYHLHTDWLHWYGLEWCEESEAFVCSE
ncbi:MAG: DUF927 domain-containing protein [Pseudomonas sp.]|nr:DUF927 domain-containing protein [Pseudomonas sp.]